jgi:hypothetical protein
MSLHDDITSTIDQLVADADTNNAVYASPTAIAVDVHSIYGDDDEDDHIKYASIEHFKHMARKRLARRYDYASQEALESQDDMFSGELQQRYPIPRKLGEEPQYKLRHLLTDVERAFNLEKMRRTASSLLAHADAFEAEWRSQKFSMGQR